MSLFLLDTNVWIALANNEPGVVRQVQPTDPTAIGRCPTVRGELMFGARKSRRVDENLAGFRRLLEPFASLPFDDLAADHYGMIRATLERAGTPIGANDLMIASIARSRDCVLVTRNQREFE